MSQNTHLAPLVLIENEPVPGRWVDELDLKSYVPIAIGAMVFANGHKRAERGLARRRRSQWNSQAQQR